MKIRPIDWDSPLPGEKLKGVFKEKGTLRKTLLETMRELSMKNSTWEESEFVQALFQKMGVGHTSELVRMSDSEIRQKIKMVHKEFSERNKARKIVRKILSEKGQIMGVDIKQIPYCIIEFLTNAVMDGKWVRRTAEGMCWAVSYCGGWWDSCERKGVSPFGVAKIWKLCGEKPNKKFFFLLGDYIHNFQIDSPYKLPLYVNIRRGNTFADCVRLKSLDKFLGWFKYNLNSVPRRNWDTLSRVSNISRLLLLTRDGQLDTIGMNWEQYQAAQGLTLQEKLSKYMPEEDSYVGVTWKILRQKIYLEKDEPRLAQRTARSHSAFGYSPANHAKVIERFPYIDGDSLGTWEEHFQGTLQLSILFGKDMQGLDRHVKNMKGNFHDAFQFVLPRFGYWNIQNWKNLILANPLCMGHIHKAGNLHIVNNGKTIVDIAHIKKLSLQILWVGIPQEFVERQPELIRILSENGESRQRVKELAKFIGKEKTAEGIPYVEVKNGNLRLVQLAHDNLVGLYLGEITSCCQHLWSAGKSCAKHGLSSPNGAFWVTYLGEELIAQAWLWKSEKGTLVIDSLECHVSKRESYKETLVGMYKQAAQQACGRLGIRRVIAGTSSGISSEFFTQGSEIVIAPKHLADGEDKPYSDAFTCVVLASE